MSAFLNFGLSSSFFHSSGSMVDFSFCFCSVNTPSPVNNLMGGLIPSTQPAFNQLNGGTSKFGGYCGEDV